MAISEKAPEDMKKLKNGVIGVVVLLVLGVLSPVIIAEFTGVDVETLCETVTDPDTGTSADVCLEDGEIKKNILRALDYVIYGVAIIGFIALVVVGVKY